MSKELQSLLDYCSEIGATIIRLQLDDDFGIVQLADGTPSGVSYNRDTNKWI